MDRSMEVDGRDEVVTKRWTPPADLSAELCVGEGGDEFG